MHHVHNNNYITSFSSTHEDVKTQKSSQHFDPLTTRFGECFFPCSCPGNTDPRFINTRLFFFTFLTTLLSNPSRSFSHSHFRVLSQHFLHLKSIPHKNIQPSIKTRMKKEVRHAKLEDTPYSRGLEDMERRLRPKHGILFSTTEGCGHVVVDCWSVFRCWVMGAVQSDSFILCAVFGSSFASLLGARMCR